MPYSLVATKLQIPPPRRHAVARPHLLARVDDALLTGVKLVLVSAPLGFGKSTLLSQWAHNPKAPPVAWLSLDEGENDPQRFWAYLVGSLRTLRTGNGSFLAELGRWRSPTDEALTALINLVVATVPHPFALVLDDYHAVTDSALHQCVSHLLERLPPQMHLLIATRADPPLGLAQLRARGQLAEIRAADLRFRQDEATAFLNEVMGLHLPPQAITALSQRTEGWIAGLQLAALSLRGREEVDGLVAAFSGSHRYIADYLTDEVLQQQPAEIQSFLLRTSVLERLCGPLCQAVTGSADAQVTLERLEALNLFLVPLDDTRRWYRYHPLVADVLRNRLRKDRPGQVRSLHRRASLWYEGEGLAPEAFQHAVDAGDLDRAAQLVEANARDLLWRGEVSRLQGWLQALPQDLVLSRPWLSLYFAWVLFYAAQVDELYGRLRDAERALQRAPVSDAEANRLQSEIGVLRVLSSVLSEEDATFAVELAQETLQRTPTDQTSNRGFVQLGLAFALHSTGELAQAAATFEEAMRLFQSAGNVGGVMVAALPLARLYQALGSLRQAYQACQRVVEESAGVVGHATRPPALGLAYIGLADLLYEWDRLSEAETYAREAAVLGEQGGSMKTLVHGYLMLARVRQALGDSAGALEAAERVQELVGQKCGSLWSGVAAVIGARQALTRGDAAAAEPWAEGSGLDPAGEPNWQREFEWITLARVLLAQGRLEQALALLERLQQLTAAGQRTGRLIEVLVLTALAQQGQGTVAAAVDTLGQALALAEPEGYQRTFVDEGTPVAELLVYGLERGAWQSPGLTAYARRLLTCFGLPAPERCAAAGQPPGEARALPREWQLTESLTRRELEVLELLAAGAANQEIAHRLVITMSTAKTHLRNIYGKLGGRTRGQAVARARALRLVP